MKRILLALVIMVALLGCTTLPEGAERVTLEDGTQIVVLSDEFTGTTWTTVSFVQANVRKNAVSTIEIQYATSSAHEWYLLKHKLDHGSWYFLDTCRWIIDGRRGGLEHFDQDRQVISGSRVLELNWYEITPGWVEGVIASEDARLSFRGDRGSIEVSVDDEARSRIRAWYDYIKTSNE